MEFETTIHSLGPRVRRALALGVLWMGFGLQVGLAQDAKDAQGDAQGNVQGVDQGVPEVLPVATSFAPVGAGYHDLQEMRELLEGWVRFGGEHVRWVEDMGGAMAIEFGGGDLLRRPLNERRTVLLVGGLDGRSLAGGEAVLHAGFALLSDLTALRPDLTFLLVPAASPDGLARVHRGQAAGGRDLDGDGLVLEMLVEDSQGPWTPSGDARFLCRAKPGDGPRYQRLIEGAQGSSDGHGFDLERDFPLLSRAGATSESAMDLLPKSGVAAALRDYVLAKPCALVVSFQGNHGGLAYPGASPTPPWQSLPDAGLYQNLGRAFGRATGRARAPVQSLLQARGGEVKGSFVDWCYAVPGVLAFEVAPWGVGFAQGEPTVVLQKDAWDFRPAMDKQCRSWAQWLDDERGGLGFTEWHPVQLPGGETCQVGGWNPKTYSNPPGEMLGGALEGLDGFVSQLVKRLPYLELCDVSVRREGELCHVGARLRCVGSIPFRTQAFGRWGGAQEVGDAWLRIHVPQTIQLIAGPESLRFSNLSPGARSAPVRWLLHAPEGARLGVGYGLLQRELGLKELFL